jgi:MFS family permease
MTLPRSPSGIRKAATALVDRLVDPPMRRNFFAFLGDYIMFGAGFAFINPSTVLPALVRSLTDSAPLIGLVGTLYNGIWFIPQLFMAWFLSGTVIRRRHMVVPLIASRCFLLLVVPVLLVFAADRPQTAVALLFALLTLNIVFDAIGSLPWFDLVSHALSPVGRSRLFGMGQFFGGAAGTGAGVVVAAILGSGRPRFPVNYALLFSIAVALFTLELLIISRIRIVRPELRGVRLPLLSFLPRLAVIVKGDRRYRRLLLVRLVAGASGLATPFYMVCALDRLGLGSASVGIFTAAQLVGGIACAPLVAFLTERRGTTATIRVGTGLGLCLPLLGLGMLAVGPRLPMEPRMALFSLIFVVMGAMSNAVAAGFMNYLLDISPAETRTTYVGFANTFEGLSLAFPLVGGWILARLSWVTLFCVTAAAAAAGLIATFGMPESRPAAAGRQQPD